MMTYEKLAFFHACSTKENMLYLIQKLAQEDNDNLVTQFLLDTTDVLCELSDEQYKQLKYNASDDENPFLTTGLSLQNYEYTCTNEKRTN